MMFRKQSKLSKELLHQPLFRQNIILSHSKYTLFNSIELKSLSHSHSCTISTSSEHLYYKNSVSQYHTNKQTINNKQKYHKYWCQCHLCHKSNFHSSPHLYEQE
eukprot:275872_1